MIAVGHPNDIAAWMETPSGRRFCLAKARNVFRDEAQLADFELGLLDLPRPVAREIDRMITVRNQQEKP